MTDVEEARRVTPGLIRAIGKMKGRAPCDGCGFPMPTYPGRYPKTCPGCGDPRIEEKKEGGDGSRVPS